MSNSGQRPDSTNARASRLSTEQRRQRLLTSAVKVFAKHGLEGANHALVAAEASVSVPLCFFYFKTREALLDAVLSEVEKQFQSAFALADNDLDASQGLKRTSDALLATLDDERYHTAIFIEWSVLARSPIWPRFLNLHRFLVEVLARVIARGQSQGHFRADLNPEDEAEHMHAASFALAQLKMTGASSRRIERFQESMIRRIQVESRRL